MLSFAIDKNTDCEPTSASPVYMQRCAFPGNRGFLHTRKKSHDEKSRFSRIDNDADCNLRTGVCGHRITECAVLVQCERLFGPASDQRLQCFRSGNGRTDGRAQRVPLPWRTEIERLTFDVLDTGSRQFVQGHLDLSGRRFLCLRFAAQECGLGHARVHERDIGIGRPRPGPCVPTIRLGFTRAQLAKIGLPYQSGKIARRYGGPVRENRGRGRNGNRSERSPLPRPRDSGSPR